jgi:hypothetical protein
MIRSLWMIISTIALANLLALGGFLFWLHSSDRLDMDRLERIREILSETRAAEQTRLDATAEQERTEELRQREEAAAALPPLTSSERLFLNDESDLIARQRIERMRREIEDLQRTLRTESARLDEREQEVQARRDEFLAMREQIARIEGDQQFKKTVNLLETMRPNQAQGMLQTLIDAGDVEQVVAYLNAMQPRTASRIVALFPDPVVAADLLERLRTYGLGPDRQ